MNLETVTIPRKFWKIGKEFPIYLLIEPLEIGYGYLLWNNKFTLDGAGIIEHPELSTEEVLNLILDELQERYNIKKEVKQQITYEEFEKEFQEYARQK